MRDVDKGELRTFDHDQTLPGGFHMPTRMTVVPLGGGSIALISPIPLDEATASAVDALGEVALLVAPNALHHLYLAAAKERYPRARVLAPARAQKQHPGLAVGGSLADLAGTLAASCDVVPIEGAPSMEEHAIFHRATRTLVVTDLVFNVTHPRGFTANVFLSMVGCNGRLAQSRAWSWFFVKDRKAAATSVARVLELPIERLVPAHGAIVDQNAHAALSEALV